MQIHLIYNNDIDSSSPYLAMHAVPPEPQLTPPGCQAGLLFPLAFRGLAVYTCVEEGRCSVWTHSQCWTAGNVRIRRCYKVSYNPFRNCLLVQFH